jgi:thioester reductase-like protein
MSIAKHIFLTGATGVLGRELVPRLLRDHPGARLTALLRPGPSGSVVDRLAAIRADVDDDSRVDAVAGDIGAPGLGLSERTRSGLCRSVTHVIHGAATTRLDAAPDVARNVNVDGTLRALALAESCRRLELYAQVSTALVCGDREGLVHEWELARGQRFLNSYEESKYRAEFEVRRRSLEIPVAVFRPSIIVGDSRTGRVSSFASLYSPLRHIADGTLRRMPFAANARLDLIPVDRVAESIARLTARSCAAGEVYHLCAGPGRRISMEQLMGETIRIAGSAAGAPLRFDDGSRLAPDTPERMRVFFEYLRFDREFSVTRAEEHLGNDVGLPPDHYLEPMLEYCRRTDWGRLPVAQEAVA